MNRQEIKMSIHMSHPTRDLSEVCAVFGLKPRVIWKRGDERMTPKGQKIGGIRTSSYCSIELGKKSRKSLPEQIEDALPLLKPHRSILRRLSSSGGSISFYVGWFFKEDAGERFGWQILREMSDLRIDLELNIYLPDKESKSPHQSTF
jgi:Domain of unknown function (DUF4279)